MRFIKPKSLEKKIYNLIQKERVEELEDRVNKLEKIEKQLNEWNKKYKLNLSLITHYYPFGCATMLVFNKKNSIQIKNREEIIERSGEIENKIKAYLYDNKPKRGRPKKKEGK